MTTYALKDISALLNVSKVTVGNWLDAGCPYIAKPDGKHVKEWALSLPAVVAWLRKRDVDRALSNTSTMDMDEAKLRKTAAEAALAELELAKQRGDVVSISMVAEIVGEQMSACKARLLALPTKGAPLVSPEDDLKANEATLTALVREACDELVGYGVTELASGSLEAETGDSAPDRAAVSAAADPDGEPVGRRVPKTQRRGKRRARSMEHGPQ